MAGVTSRGRLTIPVLQKRLAALSGPPFRSELSQVLAAAAGKRVNDQFQKSQDPYGNLWAPVARDRRGPGRGRSGPVRYGKPLLKTGRGRASFASQPLGGKGFRIDATASYMRYHQTGTEPHQKRARVAKQSARGRFVRRKKAGLLLTIRAHQHPGIKRRQMLPDARTGGLGPIWTGIFDRETAALIERKAGGR